MSARLLAVTALLAGLVAAPHSSDSLVRTDNGTVSGTVTSDSRSFQGIPYAAPPTGKLRWVAPQPAASWSGTRDASKPASACPQAADFIGDAPSLNEDCLYLNVTTPRRTSNKKLPVMVWVHGGGYYSGSGSIYDPRAMAVQGGVVVVTLNYRLGALGFLANSTLDGGRQLSGDFGLQDQQAALRWVQRNAAGFGGDAHNVTLFGESAGAMSTCTHLAAPGSAGLFSRAIIQSGPCSMRWTDDQTWTTRPRTVAEAKGAAVAKQLGCTTAACLRAVPVAKILEIDGGYGFGPVVGGPVLPIAPTKAFETGRFNRVPVMQGITRDEHSTFTAGMEIITGQVATAADYPVQLRATFGDLTPKVLARYPLSNFPSPSKALATVFTDSMWGCSAGHTDQLLSHSVPTYAYEFADRQAPWFADAPKPAFAPGAFHAGELQYLFHWSESGPLTAAQQKLSRQMIQYWTNFAHNSNPNGAALTSWPTYPYVQSLAPNAIHNTSLDTEHKCSFWRPLGY
jgi:para-nitrobenzyl esterase